MPKRLTPYQKLVKQKAREGYSGAALFHAAAAAHRGGTSAHHTTHHRKHKVHHRMHHPHAGMELVMPGHHRLRHHY